MNGRDRLLVGAICGSLGTAVAAFGAHAMERMAPDLAVGVRGAGYGALLLGAHLYQTGSKTPVGQVVHLGSSVVQSLLYGLCVLGALAAVAEPAPAVTALAYSIPILLLPLATRSAMHESRATDLWTWGLEIGAIIFVATLLAISYSGLRLWGAVTPIGGLLMIVGWAGLAKAAFQEAVQQAVDQQPE